MGHTGRGRMDEPGQRNGGAQRGGDQLRATLSVSGRARSCWAPGDEGGPYRVVGGVCSVDPCLALHGAHQAAPLH